MNQRLLLFILIVLSCKQPKTNVADNSIKKVSDTTSTVSENSDDNFEPGKVIDQITISNDPSQSFAIYLPKKYNPSLTYPVVYFFDSHASGRLPLDKYYTLADEFNFILVGSNNSKNGMQPDAILNVANNLINDVQKRFTINIGRQYTAGFSGGARVAGMVAMQVTSIAGVIACSAGINTNNQNKLPFAVVGIAGKEDFNMTELIELNKTLDKTAVQHQLLLFNGKHEWCPTSTMKDAIIFLETVAMRNKTASVNNTLLTNFRTTTENEAKKMQAANNLIEAANNFEKLINYLDELYDTKPYKTSLQSIRQNKNYQTEVIKQEQLIVQENQLREHYYKSFGKEISWWNSEVTKINNEIIRQGMSDEAFVLKRLLGSLSLASYMQANTAINTNELDKANYILEIYRLVDPTNSEAWYLSAAVHAKQGNTLLCLQELQNAISNGFVDHDRILNDPSFHTVRGTPEFMMAINKIKK